MYLSSCPVFLNFYVFLNIPRILCIIPLSRNRVNIHSPRIALRFCFSNSTGIRTRGCEIFLRINFWKRHNAGNAEEISAKGRIVEHDDRFPRRRLSLGGKESRNFLRRCREALSPMKLRRSSLPTSPSLPHFRDVTFRSRRFSRDGKRSSYRPSTAIKRDVELHRRIRFGYRCSLDKTIVLCVLKETENVKHTRGSEKCIK